MWISLWMSVLIRRTRRECNNGSPRTYFIRTVFNAKNFAVKFLCAPEKGWQPVLSQSSTAAIDGRLNVGPGCSSVVCNNMATVTRRFTSGCSIVTLFRFFCSVSFESIPHFYWVFTLSSSIAAVCKRSPLGFTPVFWFYCTFLAISVLRLWKRSSFLFNIPPFSVSMRDVPMSGGCFLALLSCRVTSTVSCHHWDLTPKACILDLSFLGLSLMPLLVSCLRPSFSESLPPDHLSLSFHELPHHRRNRLCFLSLSSVRRYINIQL